MVAKSTDPLDPYGVHLRRSYVSLITGKDESMRVTAGCLVDYQGRRFLLTVRHATQGRLPVAVTIPGGRAAMIETFHYARSMTTDGVIGPRGEAALAEVPQDFRGVRLDLTAHPAASVEREWAAVHAPSAFGRPVAGVAYGMAGETSHDLSPWPGQLPEMQFDETIHRDFAFLRSAGEMHHFRPPIAHPGHESFRGMSGTPIMDAKCSIVALLSGGCPEINEVWGVRMECYIRLMNHYLLEHGGA